MSNYAISLKRTSLLLAALAFTAALLVVNLSIFGKADAAQFSTRSLTLTSALDGTNTTGAANTELNGSNATHTFAFENGTAGTVLSMQFDYCTTAIGSCTAPDVTLDVETGASITTQTHEGTPISSNAFTIDATSDANTLRITRASGGAFGTGTSGELVFAFDSITNPSTEGTFFVRMTSYSAANWTSQVDDGTVASAITTGISITSRVAETLGFSTSGALTNGAGGDTDPSTTCAPITGTGAITLGDPTENTLAINGAYDNYSGFRIYTNAANSTLVQYEGDTLRRGGAVDIDPVGGTATPADFGVEQFGLAADLVNGGTAAVDIASSNTDRDLTFYNTGTEATGVVDGGSGAGGITISANYRTGAGTLLDGGAGTADFAFVGDADTSTTPQTIATGSGFIDCASVAIRYVANIAPTTPAGTYTTTIVYSAVPTF